MKREYRGGREARQHRNRLAFDDGETERLARLKRDAMDKNPRVAKSCDDPMGKIASAFWRSAGEDNQVASCKRGSQSNFESALVIGKCSERDGFASGFRDRGCKDGAVAVVDSCRPERAARSHQLVPGREHRHLGFLHDRYLGDAASRQHPDLPWRDDRLAPEDHFPARNVWASIRDELPRSRWPAQLDGRRSVLIDQFRLLDHQHGVGAARNDAAGRDRGCRIRLDLKRRRMTADDDFAIQSKSAWRNIAGANGIGRSERKSIHVGAVEWRHVRGSNHILRKHAAERKWKRHSFVLHSRWHVDPTGEAGIRLFGRDHLEELLLARGSPDRGNKIWGVISLRCFQDGIHGQGLTATSLSFGWPSLSGAMRIQPFARLSAETGT
jgi:hypothetical protein